MKTSLQYYDFAEDCLRLANKAKTEDERKILQEMAATCRSSPRTLSNTRCATHWGLICLVGGSSGHAAPWLRGRTASGQARRHGTVLPPGSSSAIERECARYVRSRAPRS
jgi:hypothetical protein